MSRREDLLEAWERFTDEMGDRELQAVAAAFVYVATADRDVAHDEVQRFLHVVRAQPAFRRVDEAALEARFRELAQAILDDPKGGRSIVLEAVEGIVRSPEACRLVVRAAQVAVVADESIRPQEEAALRELCEVLGVEEEEL